GRLKVAVDEVRVERPCFELARGAVERNPFGVNHFEIEAERFENDGSGKERAGPDFADADALPTQIGDAVNAGVGFHDEVDRYLGEDRDSPQSIEWLLARLELTDEGKVREIRSRESDVGGSGLNRLDVVHRAHARSNLNRHAGNQGRTGPRHRF